MAATILLVDDSPTILNLLRLTLRQAGYKVAAAGDGLEALEMLEVMKVDLIITDVNMPRMDGLTLIARLRDKAATCNLPIIVLSTQHSLRDHKMGKDAGADMYLDKPVTPQELIENIEQLLAMRNDPSVKRKNLKVVE
jgi:two-component system chemotaxis response regulator CheY